MLGLPVYKTVIRKQERRRVSWRIIDMTRSWDVERWSMEEVTNAICNFFVTWWH